MPKIDLSKAAVRTTCAYPSPYDAHCVGRSKQAIGDIANLTQFGVNLTRLAPGAASAHRHWHALEDEFVFILEGEAVLVEDDGETVLKAGEAAAFKAGVENGHMLVNRSDADVVFLEVGARLEGEISTYTDPDIDMRFEKQGGEWLVLHRNGDPY